MRLAVRAGVKMFLNKRNQPGQDAGVRIVAPVLPLGQTTNHHLRSVL